MNATCGECGWQYEEGATFHWCPNCIAPRTETVFNGVIEEDWTFVTLKVPRFVAEMLYEALGKTLMKPQQACRRSVEPTGPFKRKESTGFESVGTSGVGKLFPGAVSGGHRWNGKEWVKL